VRDALERRRRAPERRNGMPAPRIAEDQVRAAPERDRRRGHGLTS
jgi:hypothetical protein